MSNEINLFICTFICSFWGFFPTTFERQKNGYAVGSLSGSATRAGTVVMTSTM